MVNFENLKAKLLVAMPGIRDSLFRNSVIFICEHDKHGAMGLILNKPIHKMVFSDLLSRLELAEFRQKATPELLSHPIMRGGPLQQNHGSVLHSRDYKCHGDCRAIGDDFGLTATLDVLRDISLSQGPKHCVVALGYAGWGPQQLEDEIMHNSWLAIDATTELVFDPHIETMHARCFQQIGFTSTQLSSVAGNA